MFRAISSPIAQIRCFPRATRASGVVKMGHLVYDPARFRLRAFGAQKFGCRIDGKEPIPKPQTPHQPASEQEQPEAP